MTGNSLYRLAASTAVEPLINRWVAWSHIIQPVTASLFVQHYQIELMKSYLGSPKMHHDICQDPKLRSGPFIDIPVERADEVAALLESTIIEMGANVQLAKSLLEFHTRLVKEARGLSLEPYYAKLPPSLGGYVELVYDYYHRPTMRFFENLLYRSPYYRTELQSLHLFEQERDDSRSFIMSTPRLPRDGRLDWSIPFADARVDELFKLDTQPQPFGHIRELLGVADGGEDALRRLLTDRPAPAREPWGGPGVRVRYVGHACVLIEWQGVNILTDPYIGVRPSAGGADRISYENLPETIDYALITHNHHDHFCLETLLRLRHRIGHLVVPKSSGIFYGDVSLKLMAQMLGFRNVVEMDALESIALPDGEIISIPFMGEHADLPHGKAAYVVRAGREQMLFAADSDCLDRRMYENVCGAIGPIQNVFIGLECVGAPLSWSCGPFFPNKPDFKIEQSRRYKGCDASAALTMLEAVSAERVFIYAMGLEPWLDHLLGLGLTEDSTQLKEAHRLLAHAREQGFSEAELLRGRRDIHLGGPAAGTASHTIPLADTGGAFLGHMETA